MVKDPGLTGPAHAIRVSAAKHSLDMEIVLIRTQRGISVGSPAANVRLKRLPALAHLQQDAGQRLRTASLEAGNIFPWQGSFISLLDLGGSFFQVGLVLSACSLCHCSVTQACLTL